MLENGLRFSLYVLYEKPYIQPVVANGRRGNLEIYAVRAIDTVQASRASAPNGERMGYDATGVLGMCVIDGCNCTPSL
jgi:hypothetical protein